MSKAAARAATGTCLASRDLGRRGSGILWRRLKSRTNGEAVLLICAAAQQQQTQQKQLQETVHPETNSNSLISEGVTAAAAPGAVNGQVVQLKTIVATAQASGGRQRRL